jgi:hypothetical protein
MRAIAGFPRFLAVFLLTLAAGSVRADSASDPDEARIAGMSLLDVALSILSLRTDLNRYDTKDLGTLSGQYELFYCEVMSACAVPDRADAQPVLCPGHSLSESFIRYVQSDTRICPLPQGDACAKPRYEAETMRSELLELVKARYQGGWRSRNAKWLQQPDSDTTAR